MLNTINFSIVFNQLRSVYPVRFFSDDYLVDFIVASDIDNRNALHESLHHMIQRHDPDMLLMLFEEYQERD